MSMDLDELKVKWKEYDHKLKDHDLLNEPAIRHFLQDEAHSSFRNTGWARYFGIIFFGFIFFFFLFMMLHVNNNPPMMFSFVIVLITILFSMGMSIYHLYYRSSVWFNSGFVIDTGGQMFRTPVMAGSEKVFSAIFSPIVTVSLFMLLFLGLTIKTF